MRFLGQSRHAGRERFQIMSTPHEFGVPDINVHKRTTKVNFSVIAGVLLFFAVSVGLFAWFFWRRG